MKFSDYFHATGVRLVSILFGGVIGLGVSFFWNWKFGILAGAILAILTSIILPIRLYRADLPYFRIKQKITDPFLLDERVRFTVRGGTVGGFFILTQNRMIFLSLEQGDHRLELSRDDVKSVQLGEDMTISIFLNDKQFIRVISGISEQMYDVLCENGWIAS